jgi:hypothetical protein
LNGSPTQNNVQPTAGGGEQHFQGWKQFPRVEMKRGRPAESG